jgi:hypothetical protein
MVMPGSATVASVLVGRAAWSDRLLQSATLQACCRKDIKA